MGNSPLVGYTRISPNKTVPRNKPIDTITIHCIAGNASVETLGAIFAPASVNASSNYGVGSDGRIGMYCEEKDRSWCTSSAANDHRAVTIEVANDGPGPEWHVNDTAMAALIRLCADICRRNGIKRLLWKGDKSLTGDVAKQNMTVHRWFANKTCPGDYLYGKMGYVAEEANRLLGAEPSPAPPAQTTPPSTFAPYIVTVKATALNIRGGPGTNNPVVATLRNDRNVYTIVEEAAGPGASKWCRLKSGIGWASWDYLMRK